MTQTPGIVFFCLGVPFSAVQSVLLEGLDRLLLSLLFCAGSVLPIAILHIFFQVRIVRFSHLLQAMLAALLPRYRTWFALGL